MGIIVRGIRVHGVPFKASEYWPCSAAVSGTYEEVRNNYDNIRMT